MQLASFYYVAIIGDKANVKRKYKTNIRRIENNSSHIMSIVV